MSVPKIAMPVPNTQTDASHQATALPGSRTARSRHATSTAMTAQPSTTMLVYLLNVAASSATKPASPASATSHRDPAPGRGTSAAGASAVTRTDPARLTLTGRADNV